MNAKERIKIISEIVRLIYLYFGGKQKMENVKKFQTPEFLKKHTKVSTSEEKEDTVSLFTYDEPVDISNPEVEEPKHISPMEREALLRTINGLSPEQIDIILDNIPIELVYNRLGRELQRNKEFAVAVSSAMKFAK